MTVLRRRQPDPDPMSAKDREFWEYHDNNPWVLRHMEKLCYEALDKGFHRIGIDLIVNLVRWETQTRTSSSDGFKINQNHAARYSRLLMHLNEDFENLFELRHGKVVDGFDVTRGGTL